MLIVSGSVQVDPATREEYLRGCAELIMRARAFEGCLDLALSADPVDPGRINLYERWDSDAPLDRFRREGPTPVIRAELLDERVEKYHISSVEPAF